MTTKRTAILEATLELISEQGFHGTAMSMIADKAGVGAGTIYRYFDSKEDLITQLYLEIKREKGKAFSPAIPRSCRCGSVFGPCGSTCSTTIWTIPKRWPLWSSLTIRPI